MNEKHVTLRVEYQYRDPMITNHNFFGKKLNLSLEANRLLDAILSEIEPPDTFSLDPEFFWIMNRCLIEKLSEEMILSSINELKKSGFLLEGEDNRYFVDPDCINSLKSGRRIRKVSSGYTKRYRQKY